MPGSPAPGCFEEWPRLHTPAGGPDHGVRPRHSFVRIVDGIGSETELPFTQILWPQTRGNAATANNEAQGHR